MKESKIHSAAHLIVLCIFCIVVSSCTKEKVHAADYLKYVEQESNGLKVSKKIGDVAYTLQYKPLNYIILKESTASGSEKREADLSGMQYFTLSYSLIKSNKDILKANLDSPDEYYERVNYFSFGLADDIYLIEGTDTMSCKLFNYVRSYGLSPRADFVLAFNESKHPTMNDKLLVLDDKVYGGGILKFKISKKDIENIPELIKTQL